MTKKEGKEPAWETPSLDWIHRVRRESQAAREGRQPEPLTRQAAEALVERFGLKLARPEAASGSRTRRLRP